MLQNLFIVPCAHHQSQIFSCHLLLGPNKFFIVILFESVSQHSSQMLFVGYVS